ncbi:MAG: methylated-DNA--[protein]-cysteine S-methyltransferase [Roseburia sp.]|nr:methylated-DNA--[protein]-cysteine S-methyltransferase [Roseburia sp.]
MHYVSKYNSPIGGVTLASNGTEITGLWFDGQKYYACNLPENCVEKDLPVFERTKEWLDVYFSGNAPDFTPPLSMEGTPFKKRVWEILREIPYGKTTTYGEIARRIESETGKRVSAQAVGGAVGHNPVSVIVPCHRVVGANGSLTGYAGGIDKKIYLLKSEGVDVNKFTLPEK